MKGRKLFRELFLAAALCLSAQAFPAGQVEQAATTAAGICNTTCVTTFGQALKAGSTVDYFAVGSGTSSILTGVTMSISGAMSCDTPVSDGTNALFHCWKQNVAAGAQSLTATVNQANGIQRTLIVESSGVVTSGGQDASLTTPPLSSNTTQTTGTLTPLSSGDLLLCFLGTDGGSGLPFTAASPGTKPAGAEDSSQGRFTLQWKTISGTTPTGCQWSLGTARTGGFWLVAWKSLATVAPTFTSAPALGTLTSSTIPVNFTLSATGNVYGIIQAVGGAAPSCTQVKAGQNGAGGAAINSWTQAVTGATPASHSFTVSTAPVDAYFCGNDTVNDSLIASLLNVFKLPAFTSNPAVSIRSADGYTLAFQCDGTGVVYSVAQTGGLSAPSSAQVVAGQDSSGGAARAATNKAVTSAADTVILSGLQAPVSDLYTVCRYGGNSTAAVAQTTQSKGSTTGMLPVVTLVSIDANSFCHEANKTASPVIANGDIVEVASAVQPSGAQTTLNTDCTVLYPGGTTRQLLCYRIFRAATQAFMTVASPSLVCPSGFANTWVNNHASYVRTGQANMQIFVPYNKQMPPQDLSQICGQDDGDTPVVSPVDALPGNLAITVVNGKPTLGGIKTDRTSQLGANWKCCDKTNACTGFQ